MQKTSPLEPILTEIERALDVKFFYLAIVVTLTLPEICVSLQSSDGKSSPERYKKWFDDNLAKTFTYVTGDDLYSMRCGVVHNGRFGDLKHNVARVIFALPGSATYRDCAANDAYFYSVNEFCRDFIVAVRRWYEANKNDPNIEANLPRLIRYHPKGMPPYVWGFPVIG